MKPNQKRPAFAILRFEDAASAIVDQVAVKGVFDDAAQAEAELQRLRGIAKEATYVVVATRYSPSESAPAPEATPRLPPTSAPSDEDLKEALALLKSASAQFRSVARPGSLMSLASNVALMLVASAMRAPPESPAGPDRGYDLHVGEQRVEVKSVMLQANPKKSPAINVRPADFDILAIVAFSETFDLLGVYKIAREQLDRFLRPSHLHPIPMAVARVTPELLSAAERIA